jgi:hypothetical protein
MEFQCSICEYTSPYKINTERHINKKKKCGENPSIIEIRTNIICEYCNKSYKTRDNLINHYKVCKVKKADIVEENRLLKEEINQLKKQASINIKGNNNTINNNTINNNYTIQLTSYDNPKLPDDMDDIYEDAWEKQKSIQTYIERVHFSADMPENHNICITNLRTKLAAKVFNGTRWETKDQNKILDEIIENTNKILDKWVRTNKTRREKYEGAFIEFVENEGRKKFDEETKNELKLLLYDSYKNGTVDIKSGSKQICNDKNEESKSDQESDHDSKSEIDLETSSECSSSEYSSND